MFLVAYININFLNVDWSAPLVNFFCLLFILNFFYHYSSILGDFNAISRIYIKNRFK